MRLAIDNRGDFWKLDLNAEGWLAKNVQPHEAPALSKDDQGNRQIIAWNHFEVKLPTIDREKSKTRILVGDAEC